MNRPLWPVLAPLALLAAAALPVEFDEAYYWAWSQDLSLNYFDHPPGVAYALALTAWLPGKWGLRLPALISVAIAGWALAAAAAMLRPGAAWATWRRFLGAPLVVLGCLPLTPDPLQLAGLSLGTYALVRALKKEAKFWMFATAFFFVASIGLKHSSALVLVGVSLGLASHPVGRRWLRHPAALSGALLGLALLLPWLWAERSGGATVFQWRRVFGDRPLAPGGPFLAVAALGLLGPWAWRGVYPGAWSSLEARALGCGALALLLGCMVAAALGTGEVNWVLPAVVVLPAVESMELKRLEKQRLELQSLWTLLSFILLMHVLVPILPLAPGKDRTLRSAGYQQVVNSVDQMARQTGAQALVAHRYQIASLLRFYGRDAWPVYLLPSARPSQYDRWARPTLCRGDRVVVLVPGDDVLADWPFVPDGPLLPVQRRRGALVIETLRLGSGRMGADLSPGCPAQ